MPDTLVVVAHPDDEVLGAGGTIARLRQEGSQVRILFLSDGVSSRGTACLRILSSKDARKCSSVW